MMNIIDHLGLQVSDYARALRFYTQALAPLGISVIMRVTKEETGGYEGAGFGRDGKPSFWISSGERTAPRVHVAFVADGREAVDRFFEAGLAAGGVDNGAPGIRAHYHPDYYGAFVLDPDGHNIEAVCHAPA
jgi:catechol 2,3-dioxygenase-like lactoylglutathione lyase family enzyme